MIPATTTPPERATPASQAWPTLAARATLWVAIAAALYAYARLFQRTYIDDTYITLVYVRNLAEHASWGFFPGQTTNTATSPLNAMVLAAFAKVTGSALTTVALTTAIEWTLTLAVLLGISRRVMGTAHAGLVTFAILITNPLLLSAIGLEGDLSILLLLTALLLFLARRWPALAVALGLLTLTRPEGVLFLAIVLVLLPAGWRTRGQLLLTYGLTILPWYLFSWIHLGSLIPDTLLIKLDQQPWEGTTQFGNGPLLYLDHFPAATLGSVWPLAFVPFALPVLRRATPVVRRALAALAVYAVVHYLAYAALGVPPFHWYYTPQVVAIAVLGGVGAGELLRRLSRRTGSVRRTLSYAATALPAVAVVTLLAGPGSALDQAAIHSNWARPDQYRAIAATIQAEIPPDATVDFRGEVGTLSYYSDRYLLDTFTDMRRTGAAIDRLRDGRSGPARWLLDLNFHWRDAPVALPAPTYVIDFAAPRLTPGVDPAKDPSYVDSWVTWSRWVPFNRIVLSRVPAVVATAPATDPPVAPAATSAQAAGVASGSRKT